MKKIIIFSLLMSVGFASCKKDPGNPSLTVTVSYPTITLTGAQYYSIAVGGNLPSIAATAYDSFYRESDAVVMDLSSLDASTPGLYAVTASATNKYGFVGNKTVYVGVTNEPSTFDISGTYIRLATAGCVAHVTKVATGMFLTDNVGGVDITVPSTGAAVPAVFVVTSDSTIDFGTQLTNAGTLSASSESLTLVAGGGTGTTLAYAISLSGFGTSVRTFVKQ